MYICGKRAGRRECCCGNLRVDSARTTELLHLLKDGLSAGVECPRVAMDLQLLLLGNELVWPSAFWIWVP